MTRPVFAIIGAGPTGLETGYRLQELKYSTWAVYKSKISTFWVKNWIRPQTRKKIWEEQRANNTFLYPKRGGMGRILNALAALFDKNIEFFPRSLL